MGTGVQGGCVGPTSACPSESVCDVASVVVAVEYRMWWWWIIECGGGGGI